MSDFATIKSKVEGWVLDLPAATQAQIGNFVNHAITAAAERHNFRFMESEVTPAPVSTAENQRLLVAKPSDWKESRGLPFLLWQDGTTTEIDWAGSESEMNRSYAYQVAQETNTTPADSGQPKFLLEKPDDIWVYPLPDLLSGWANGNYRVKIPYWAMPAALVQDGDSNFITDNGEQYVIWKAVSLAFMFNRDEERGDYYERKAEPEYRRVVRRDKLAQLPDRITLAPRKDAYAGPSRSTAYRG